MTAFCCKFLSHLYLIQLHLLCLNTIISGEKGGCGTWSTGSPSSLPENHSIRRYLDMLTILIFMTLQNAWNKCSWWYCSFYVENSISHVLAVVHWPSPVVHFFPLINWDNMFHLFQLLCFYTITIWTKKYLNGILIEIVRTKLYYNPQKNYKVE
jgi:hypothetical protein